MAFKQMYERLKIKFVLFNPLSKVNKLALSPPYRQDYIYTHVEGLDINPRPDSLFGEKNSLGVPCEEENVTRS